MKILFLLSLGLMLSISFGIITAKFFLSILFFIGFIFMTSVLLLTILYIWLPLRGALATKQSRPDEYRDCHAPFGCPQ